MFDKLFKKKEEPKEIPTAVKALAALQNGNFSEALKYLDEYITMLEGLTQPLTCDDAVFYYNRNIAKTQLNNIDGAIEDLKKCISICDMHQAYFELFRLLHFKGENKNSLNYLVKAYELGNKEAEQILRENTNYFNR